jgi:heptose I phosphotransferase
MNHLVLNIHIKQCLHKLNPTLDDIMTIQGEVFRAVKNRQTIRFTCGNDTYFIKKHFAIGWWEILKNLSQFRMPIISARNEYRALKKLASLGINTPKIIGYGEQGYNPATKKSFIITAELTNCVGMRDIAKQWAKHQPDFYQKKNIIEEIARITRIMHNNGINHRDLYLAHFLLAKNQNLTKKNSKPILYLFDPHRAQIRNKIPKRWLIKDLASLYFSSMEANLTRKDILRFLQIYFKRPWQEVIKQQQNLLQKIRQQAIRLYRKKKI